MVFMDWYEPNGPEIPREHVFLLHLAAVKKLGLAHLLGPCSQGLILDSRRHREVIARYKKLKASAIKEPVT